MKQYQKHTYQHDCDNCVYLGQYVGVDRTRPADGIVTDDLYFCKSSPSGHITVISRRSDEGGDYVSGLVFALNALDGGEAETYPIAQAVIRALEKGLTTEEEMFKQERRFGVVKDRVWSLNIKYENIK